MGIIEQITKEDFKKSKGDKILIDYINNNAKDCIYKSISELARDVSLGEATITRFTRKLGFLGYQDFKVTLVKRLSRDSGENVISAAVDLDESVEVTAEKLFESHQKAITETLKMLNYENIIKIRELLLTGKKIYFFGIGNSGMVAMEANYKFMRIGLNSVTVSDSHTMMMLASLMQRGDIIFAISHSGETREILKVAELAKSNKAKIISVTESRYNSLKELSDINISYISTETVFETGSISSKFAQLFLIELIYAEVLKESYDEALEKKIKTTNALEELKDSRKK